MWTDLPGPVVAPAMLFSRLDGALGVRLVLRSTCLLLADDGHRFGMRPRDAECAGRGVDRASGVEGSLSLAEPSYAKIAKRGAER